MNAIIGEFRLGEDLSVALDASGGDTSSVSAISAMIKPAQVAGNRFVIDHAASGITMQVATQSPASAGWTISLDHFVTAGLAEGIYGIDARLTIGSGVEMTDQSAFVRLSRATVV